MIDQIIEYNKEFVAEKGYEKYITDKYPDKKLAVLSCMDTRLTELLPAALGLKNGDAKIIKNAGGLVISAFDSAMRSLIVAVYELGVEEIMVVAHSHCGACHMSYSHFHEQMIAWHHGQDSRHDTQVRHRPQHMARRLQRHARISAQNRGDDKDASPHSVRHHRPRLHHRLGNGMP